MHVYPNPESWDEFYPSEIFIAVGDEPMAELVPILKKANIGATITIGDVAIASKTYKKVRGVEALADIDTSLVLLARVTPNGN